jgi:hypothetical protein
MLKTSAYGRANYQIKNTLSAAYTPIKDKDVEEIRESAKFKGGEEQKNTE